MGWRRTVALVVGAILPMAAQAHAGHADVSGFMQGMMHPFSGLDHILAMAAVGMLTVRPGGEAAWSIPAAFLASLLLGSVIALGTTWPHFELGVATSLIVFGYLVARHRELPAWTLATVVAAFGMFHGYAHGAELPPVQSTMPYVGGFAVATLLLLAAGASIAAVLFNGSSPVRRAFQGLGAAGIATTGLVLLANAL
jgi:urease accessory protein